MGTVNKTLLGEQFPWSNMLLKVQKEEADIDFDGKSEHKGKRRAGQQFWMDLSSILETEKKNQNGLYKADMLGKWNSLSRWGLLLSEYLSLYRRVENEVSLTCSVAICLVDRHCSLERLFWTYCSLKLNFSPLVSKARPKLPYRTSNPHPRAVHPL